MKPFITTDFYYDYRNGIEKYETVCVSMMLNLLVDINRPIEKQKYKYSDSVKSILIHLNKIESFKMDLKNLRSKKFNPHYESVMKSVLNNMDSAYYCIVKSNPI